jgi:hypothetical protein
MNNIKKITDNILAICENVPASLPKPRNAEITAKEKNTNI